MSREEWIKELNIIFFQALLINFGIVLLNGIIGLIFTLAGKSYDINVLFLIGSIIVSIITASCSIIFSINIFKRIPFIIMLVIHYILLGGIVMLASYLFGWTDFTTVYYPLMILGVYTIIYITVWIITKIKYLKDDKSINEALEANKED